MAVRSIEEVLDMSIVRARFCCWFGDWGDEDGGGVEEAGEGAGSASLRG